MDSPKHLDCPVKPDAQFYRIAGSSLYKCKSCGLVRAGVSFTPVEFTWKDSPEQYKTWRKELLQVSKHDGDKKERVKK